MNHKSAQDFVAIMNNNDVIVIISHKVIAITVSEFTPQSLCVISDQAKGNDPPYTHG